MTLLVAISGWPEEPWLARFRSLLPDLKVVSQHAEYDPAAIDYIAAWKPPHGLIAGLPNLKAILYLGAGVDHLFADPSLPDLPISRVVDDDLTLRMSEWVVMHCLMQQRGAEFLRREQDAKRWFDGPDAPLASRVRVGIMGIGVLGADAAKKLKVMGFDVAGWSPSGRSVEGIEMFAGAQMRDAFLARTDILVSLLPLTEETRGILNTALFRKLARDGALGGPILINAGRGGLQKEADILACLDDGTLKAAVLDVFEIEPLPDSSPLWLHPNVTVTPHNSAGSDPEAVAAYAVRQLRAHQSGRPMQNIVDPRRGY
jgi:glyoxylate/hydroxypyruvate reductase